MKQYIAYYRVSTQQQGRSGLGLEAQQAAVTAYIRDSRLLSQHTDIESGKSSTRKGINAAIQECKQTGAILVIAKLDRLSRNVEFIAALMNSGVKFVCCDMPDATPLTIHIFAAIAQQERQAISDRTKAALQAKKERGHTLGNAGNFSQAGRQAGANKRKQQALDNATLTPARAIAGLLRSQGATIQAIADKLNEMGLTTPTGKAFRLEQARRLLVS